MSPHPQNRPHPLTPSPPRGPHPLTPSPRRGEGERSGRASIACSIAWRSPRPRGSRARPIASISSPCIRPRASRSHACTSWAWRITRFPDCAMRWSSLLGVGVEVASPGETGPTPSLPRAVLEAAGDPDAIRTPPLPLRFVSPELEAAVTEEYQRESLRHIRFAVAMALFLVAAFGLLDAVIQPTVVRQLWLIRYGIVTPYIAVLFALTFVPGARRWVEWALAGMVLVAGGGILAMILISPAPGRYFYYAGVILVIMYDFTFLKLRFAIASVTGWSVVGLYVVAEAAVGQTPWPILMNNLFFFVSATVIGMFAAYFFEALARRNFVQGKLVSRVREFGSYRLVARLGRGGMGEVWRAEHRLLARPAAIKLIRPEMLGAADTEGRRATLRRFEREAQATALLRSPHTIQLYDFGVTDDGTFYYVMELLAGVDLESLGQRFGPLPSRRGVRS